MSQEALTVPVSEVYSEPITCGRGDGSLRQRALLARQVVKFGHEVKLIAPQYVRPFVKRQKNDAADAEAIVIAAQRPEMRFVEPRSQWQQARAVLFRARERLVRQRTELVNALRAVLYEYGHTIPQGIVHLKRIEVLLDESGSDLPGLVREECRDLLAQICEKTVRIQAKTRRIKEVAAETDATRRLQTMPGVGPIVALAVEAFAPAMASCKCGRDFAAWLGLVPRQHSSGGKERLGRVAKAGQADIRQLLIIGAMSRLTWLGRRSITEGSWLDRMLARKPKMLVAIALANKIRGRFGRCLRRRMIIEIRRWPGLYNPDAAPLSDVVTGG